MSDFSLNPKILALHVDEIAFLYTQRDNAIVSSTYYLQDISDLDNRLRGNLNGLLLGGHQAWKYCEQGLEFEERGEVFAAASFSINSQDFSKLDSVFEVAGQDIKLLNAIADAFVWSSYENFKLPLHKLAASKKHSKCYVANAALLGHRCRTDQFKRHIEKSLKSDHLLLHQQALYAVGVMGMFDLKLYLDSEFDAEVEGIAFSAVYSASQFGDAHAMEKLKRYVAHPVFGKRALQLVILQKDVDNTIHILRKLFQSKETKRLSIEGLGYIGKASSIQHLIQVMETPSLARIAGHAFSSITGLSLEKSGFTTHEPQEMTAQRLKYEHAENLIIDIDEDLPWPDINKIEQWWLDTENKYLPNESYLGGVPFSKKQLYATLCAGNQSQRLFAANCLSVYEQGRPKFNVYSPADIQLPILDGIEK